MSRYFLWYGDTRLGVLTQYELDWPWTSCHFVPDPPFAELQPLFEESYQLIQRWQQAGTEKPGGPSTRRSTPWISLFETSEDGKEYPGDCIFTMGWPGSGCRCLTGNKKHEAPLGEAPIR